METLLSLSFSNISSRDSGKIRKGLRQIEGLLAQLCLSPSKYGNSTTRRASVMEPGRDPKDLSELRDDPAFREFYRLQQGFEWNVATHLITCLERLLSMPPNSSNDTLLHSALSLLQGILLLHPPSRALFSREIYMNLLLDLLPPSLPPSIQSTTLLVLVTALLNNPANARVFEQVDGLLAVTALFKERETTRSVKLKVLEFLYFYLMDEGGGDGGDGSRARSDSQRSNGSSIIDDVGSGSDISSWGDVSDYEDARSIRSTKEKQKLLGKYLSNVDDLVQDLQQNPVFDGMVV